MFVEHIGKYYEGPYMTVPESKELDRSSTAVSKEQLFELTLQILIALVPELELHAKRAQPRCKMGNAGPH